MVCETLFRASFNVIDLVDLSTRTLYTHARIYSHECGIKKELKAFTSRKRDRGIQIIMKKAFQVNSNNVCNFHAIKSFTWIVWEWRRSKNEKLFMACRRFNRKFGASLSFLQSSTLTSGVIVKKMRETSYIDWDFCKPVNCWREKTGGMGNGVIGCQSLRSCLKLCSKKHSNLG